MRGYPRKAELMPEAVELRAEGLTYREIGERLGVSLQSVYQWLTDPGFSKARARRASYGGECLECGAPTSGAGPRTTPAERCRACSRKRNGERRREEALPQRQLVERMWAEGASAREIADAVGWKSARPNSYIAGCRKRGYDLPLRNSGASRASLGNARNRYSKARAAA